MFADSWVTERLVASQEGFSATELITLFTEVTLNNCSFCPRLLEHIRNKLIFTVRSC
jgi:hypothetical protein